MSSSPPDDQVDLQHHSREVLDRCRELGFCSAGITEAISTSHADELRTWLADGKHGQMHYLARHQLLLQDPAGLLEGARSIICVADRYADGVPDYIADGGTTGRVGRYARGDDYHRVIRRRLQQLVADLQQRHPDETFRVCVDTAPILEREYAARSGIGRIGKNTMLIGRGTGSYLLLGEVLTTMQLVPTPPVAGHSNPCGSCSRCIEACPTDAITPFELDATRCISYLTIEHRSRIDAGFHEAIGDWLFGCDICQEVCPHNQPTRRSRRLGTRSEYAPRHGGFDLLEVLGWTPEDRQQAFIRSSMKRAKLAMMKRNALICAGNVLRVDMNRQLLQRIQQLAVDESEDQMVNETALDVLRSLDPAPET